MFNKICRSMKKQKGFTLVELMVVVVIIGVLVAIAVPLYSATTTKAAKAADDANIRILNGATTQYVATADAAKYNDITTGVTITNVNGVAAESNAIITTKLITGGYLKELPLPHTNITYTYTSTATSGNWAKSGTY